MLVDVLGHFHILMSDQFYKKTCAVWHVAQSVAIHLQILYTIRHDSTSCSHRHVVLISRPVWVCALQEALEECRVVIFKQNPFLFRGLYRIIKIWSHIFEGHNG